VPVPPSADRPQSLPQALLRPEIAGPAARFALALQQQHLLGPRQQEQQDLLGVRAASDTKEAEDSDKARHATVKARAQRKISPLPSIRVGRMSHTRIAPRCAEANAHRRAERQPSRRDGGFQ
jgi:hypothetical protein